MIMVLTVTECSRRLKLSLLSFYFADLDGGKYFFNLVKEGDSLNFATDDESERTLWVQAVYRATGQTHKPVPPVVQTNKISNTQISRMQGGKLLLYTATE